MTTSLDIQRFLKSIPDAVSVDSLYELSKSAQSLIPFEPALATPLRLIASGFRELADHWDDEPLHPCVSIDVTPRLKATVRKALGEPSNEASDALVEALEWALQYPLISGANN